MANNKLSPVAVALCVLAAVALAVSIFVPLWRIELDAPQYPEGLALLIYPNKLSGDVDIINGLNHYIGMGTLHADDFVEFTVLPYIIAFFATMSALAALVRRKNLLLITTILFVLFGIGAMYDFWQWEYAYGHNLNPNAAIKVPGMAYQPPLIGFKQLLNFGAYSIPDIGGWLFIAAGISLLLASILTIRKPKTSSSAITVLLSMALLSAGCGNPSPEPIAVNQDQCNSCKMTITDERFACEIINTKGRVFKYDDLECLKSSRGNLEVLSVWVQDFNATGQWIQAEKAHYVTAEALRSPMGGNTAAFATLSAAQHYAAPLQASVTNWDNKKP